MKLADVSIRRPVFALMVSVALVTLGLFSYGSLGVDLMPRTEQPSVQVRVGLPGASAEEIETTLAYAGKQKDRNVAYGDILWALLNSTEFIANH